ncbi:class I SAM-dependent DNA methyltransferase [Streptomyces halobius]|uniref:Class I SAM-dependent methyltransferase n=1 Tax=Streptomyces halobius TaxID=2879846 RepID=A0ABY4MC91_9ACTN|nr:class I SAM-dependent methyltransferase [Streptomyces halobius]UQA95310.1 class I SAM-dependent methyltransferase [Streptomyces halobius]
MSDRVAQHYADLAHTYDQTWGHRPEYLSWMCGHIATRLPIRPGTRIADIGAGTGLFLQRLIGNASAQSPILCVDPSAAMLAQLPDDPRLHPIHAGAEEVAMGQATLPYDRLHGILIKETIHHISELDTTLKGLAELLVPGGRILVVTLPPRLEYPLFHSALDRFAERQPDPQDIADHMRESGLITSYGCEEYQVRVDRNHWIGLVANRWMSVLSSFTDEQLTDGLAEIRRRYAPGEICFPDRFAFVLGKRP